MTKNYLQVSSRLNVINRLKDGDILRFNSDVSPFVSHYAIVVKDNGENYIYHNQRSLENGYGGGIVRHKLDEYAKGRQIVSVESTDLNKEQIDRICDSLKKEKYDAINFNCEHFATLFKDKKMVSPQVANWGFALSTLIICYLLFKK